MLRGGSVRVSTHAVGKRTGRKPPRAATPIDFVETAWWEEGGPACRDYFVATSKDAGLVWIYRDRPLHEGDARWYLQGLYA